MWVGCQVTCPCCWSLCWLRLSSHSYGSDSVSLFLFWRLGLQNSGALSSALCVWPHSLRCCYVLYWRPLSPVPGAMPWDPFKKWAQVSHLASVPDLCPYLLRSYVSFTLFPFLAAQWRPCPSVLSFPSSLVSYRLSQFESSVSVLLLLGGPCAPCGPGSCFHTAPRVCQVGGGVWAAALRRELRCSALW